MSDDAEMMYVGWAGRDRWDHTFDSLKVGDAIEVDGLHGLVLRTDAEHDRVWCVVFETEELMLAARARRETRVKRRSVT